MHLVWDRLFGTYRAADGLVPPAAGVQNTTLTAATRVALRR
jgi:sterol desaturase/sphingolipid hydroxylase (fatty acid hydroxylase superfamily)